MLACMPPIRWRTFTPFPPFPARIFVKALNNLLPPTVRIKAADDVTADFHARYGARSKTYWYRILMTPVCSPLLWRFVYHHPYYLDRARMGQAAGLLEGQHDFTSFAAADGQGEDDDKSNVRVIYRSRLLWRARSSLLVYQVTGKGFPSLHGEKHRRDVDGSGEGQARSRRYSQHTRRV